MRPWSTSVIAARSPLVRAKRREEWDIPDPKEMPAEQYRKVRDLIEAKVKTLLADL